MIGIVLLVTFQKEISTCYLEDVYQNKVYNEFFLRQFNNQHALIVEYVNNCQDKEELLKIQKVVNDSLTDAKLNEVVEPSKETLTSRKESFLLFIGLSLTVIVLWFSKDFLISIVQHLCTVADLQSNIITQLDLIMQIDPEQIPFIYETIVCSN